MPFFSPLPEPAPEVEEKPAYFDAPWQRPQHWLPGMVAGWVLVRSATTAVFLRERGSYPRGLALELVVLAHPDVAVVEPWRPGRGHRFPQPRLGMQWADGRRVESGDVVGDEEIPDGEDFRLSMLGGGGGGLEWAWNLWLRPLPPAEEVAVYVEWAGRGIPETRTMVDLAPAVRVAADATELWPLPSLPDDGRGWFAYRSL